MSEQGLKTNTAELLPCPFCGSEAKCVAGWVTCSNDDCIVSDVGTVTNKWNTRANSNDQVVAAAWMSGYKAGVDKASERTYKQEN